MIDQGKRNLLGIGINVVDYDAAVSSVIEAAKNGRALGVSALAVHGVMTGVLDRKHCYRLNKLELVVPDGQPVRWGLNLIHRVGLKDRVYGPNLTLKVCEAAARERQPIYLFGGTSSMLEKFKQKIESLNPSIQIVGICPSKFRQLTSEERDELATKIRSSGAKITLVGIGCPRQEVWAFEFRELLSMPVLAVGAAFAFHAGELSQAPPWMQARGLEWFYRLTREPRRLWKRYLFLNPAYLTLLTLQWLRFYTLSPERGEEPTEQILSG
jgi:N-acetylglucosaminyldiphosphoundecaprenol N-acetyl-beta-D-mannosaminyltransferase